MSNLCYKCFRKKDNCYCQYAKDVDCGIKFVFLMHPKEFKYQKTGTGRLAHICLPESEIIMGIDFTQNQRVTELLADPSYYPVLLYPAEIPVTAKSPELKEKLSTGKKLLVFVIDSTWACSNKMIRLSPNIAKLPHISFFGNYKSVFTFKREPKEYCVSTIESCYYLIKEMQTSGIADSQIDPEPLMNVFKKMIVFQIEMENLRIQGKLPNIHPKDSLPRKTRKVPTFEVGGLVEKSQIISNSPDLQ